MSLIELVLYMGIASVLVVVLSSASISMLRSSERSERQHAINHDLIWVSETVERIASAASGVTSPSPGNASSSVVFSMYDPARDPTTIELTDGRLWIREGTREKAVLHGADMTATGTFTNVTPDGGAGSVRVYVTLSASSSGATFGADTDGTMYTTHTLPQ